MWNTRYTAWVQFNILKEKKKRSCHPNNKICGMFYSILTVCCFAQSIKWRQLLFRFISCAKNLGIWTRDGYFSIHSQNVSFLFKAQKKNILIPSDRGNILTPKSYDSRIIVTTSSIDNNNKNEQQQHVIRQLRHQ